MRISQNIKVTKGGINFHGALIQGRIRFFNSGYTANPKRHHSNYYCQLQVIESNSDKVCFRYTMDRISYSRAMKILEELKRENIVDDFGEPIIKLHGVY